MEADLILHYVQRRVREMGHEAFVSEYDHYELQPGQEIEISNFRGLLVLVGSPRTLIVRSSFGCYGLGLKNCHEHQGQIRVQNTGIEPMNATFYRAIIQD